jgi:hypothetical protein
VVLELQHNQLTETTGQTQFFLALHLLVGKASNRKLVQPVVLVALVVVEAIKEHRGQGLLIKVLVEEMAAHLLAEMFLVAVEVVPVKSVHHQAVLIPLATLPEVRGATAFLQLLLVQQLQEAVVEGDAPQMVLAAQVALVVVETEVLALLQTEQ